MKKEKTLLGVAVALSAFLLWSAYPPMGKTCSIVFALAPLLAVSRLSTPKKSAWTWFLGGFLFWFGTLSWMPAVSKNNGPLPLVILGWAGLAALCSSYFALFGWLSARAWRTLISMPTTDQSPKTRCFLRKLLLVVFVEPVLWAGIEWLRSWLFTGFAWNFLGTAVGRIPSLALPACLGGVYLVSACVVLLNGVFATIVCRMLAQMSPVRVEELRGCDVEASGRGDVQATWRLGAHGRWGRMLETAMPLGIILLFFWGANASTSRRLGDATPRLPVRVALVQRNAPCIFSRRDRQEDPLEVYDRLLDTAVAAKPHLIVWGESAMAEFGSLGSNGARHAALYFARKTGDASLLAGGDWWSAAENSEQRAWNAAALYTPTATNVMIQVYGKRHLVPFGEYIPFDKWIPALQKLSPIGVSLWPGEDKVLDLAVTDGAGHPAVVKIAPLICYEDTDPVLARKAVDLGAQAIVLITNDSWFSHSQETVQHAWQAVLRAIETGLPVIRVGNSGVTGVISPTGRARWLEDGEGKPLVDEAGTMVETVPIAVSPTRTFYSRVGDGPLIALFLLALGVVFVKFPVRSRGEAQA